MRNNRALRRWPGNVIGGLLILVGLINGVKVLGVINLDWPSVTLILSGTVVVFFSRQLNDLIPRLRKVKVKEFELILDALPLPADLRADLSGLSAHDLWALDTFANDASGSSIVSTMKAAQRVAARMLVDFKLLAVTGEGQNKRVVVTPRGEQVLSAAKSLPLASEDKNVYGFEADGKRYEVHIYFPSVPYSENSYQVYEDGKALGGRVRNKEENQLDIAKRIAKEYGGLSSLRRLL